jgi:branched-chain amino acid transport system permease protein
MAGAYLLAFAEISIIATTSGAWTDAISFGVIVVVLLLRPQGIFSRVKVDRV